ncbi:MAG: tetraacyldisaccharide 4'-kinase [Sedimentisphaerales bacterium]|nr:tetraacyldisaccharide 4'-kinase [Sedimentisphaerales bacterium]
MDQNRYRKIIGGSGGGFGVRLFRAILKPASYSYAAVIAARNFLYDKGYLRSHCAPVPVISIGNITTGGTGKTPLTIWLCNKLAEKKLKVAVLTRGYKMESQKLSDEPAVIAANCSAARVVVNPDRVLGAVTAIKEYGVKVLVMDDGFSHRRLRRNVDIITIDATCPFGYGKLLPAGLLREPLTSLRRAHAAILTRCDLVGRVDLEDIEAQLLAINPHLVLARTRHAPTVAKGANINDIELDDLAGRRVFAFSGIGNPEAFEAQLKNLKLDLAGMHVYNDHHQYMADDCADIYEEAKYLKADMILTTQKDWVKAAPLAPTEIPFAYLAVTLEFLTGEDIIAALVEKSIQPDSTIR